MMIAVCPPSMSARMVESAICPPGFTMVHAAEVCAIMVTAPYNTPVPYLGHEYQLICDSHGTCVITQDGVIMASAHLGEVIC